MSTTISRSFLSRSHDSKDPVKTEMRAGGLRYVSKSTGSDFPGAFGVTMSCFCCGRHVPRSRLESFVLAGRRQFRCRGGCGSG